VYSGGATIVWYLTQSVPVVDSADFANQTCFEPSGVTCYSLYNSVGICDTSKTLWYLAVQNQGENPATFTIDVEIDGNSNILQF
jgi:hypothetical protein